MYHQTGIFFFFLFTVKWMGRGPHRNSLKPLDHDRLKTVFSPPLISFVPIVVYHNYFVFVRVFARSVFVATCYYYPQCSR